MAWPTETLKCLQVKTREGDISPSSRQKIYISIIPSKIKEKLILLVKNILGLDFQKDTFDHKVCVTEFNKTEKQSTDALVTDNFLIWIKYQND